MAHDAQNQPYDNLLKRLLENQATVILPLLFPHLISEVLQELTVEMLIAPRRGDRVYMTQPVDRAEAAEIVHIEYEVSSNRKADKRLLIYHALLLEKYELIVNSIIVYPFEVRMVTSPLKETRRDGKELLSFEFYPLALYEQDARAYVARQAVPVYGLLPAMRETNADLLLQAFEDMLQWYGENKDLLRDELLCFRVLLKRARRLPEAEQLRVERRVSMFDQLLDEDPWVQGRVAEGMLKGKLAGKLEGKLEAFRSSLLTIVKQQFPSLVELAEVKAAQLDQPEALNVLIAQIVSAKDEHTARDILEARSNAE